MAIYKELAITKDHDKNDEVIPMDVDRVKSKKNKKKGKGTGKDTGGNSKGKQKGKGYGNYANTDFKGKGKQQKGKDGKGKEGKGKGKTRKEAARGQESGVCGRRYTREAHAVEPTG